jgi:tetratricopeptide (TPR) repeat protein
MAFLYASVVRRKSNLCRSTRALAIFEWVLGPENPGTGACLNSLASLLEARGDYAAAEPLHRRALAICERALGPEHPHTATSLNNLAWLLAAKGDYDAAEPLYRRALAIQPHASSARTCVSAEQSSCARVCPLTDQSGQRSILAGAGLSANDP